MTQQALSVLRAGRLRNRRSGSRRRKYRAPILAENRVDLFDSLSPLERQLIASAARLRNGSDRHRSNVPLFTTNKKLPSVAGLLEVSTKARIAIRHEPRDCLACMWCRRATFRRRQNFWPAIRAMQPPPLAPRSPPSAPRFPISAERCCPQSSRKNGTWQSQPGLGDVGIAVAINRSIC